MADTLAAVVRAGERPADPAGLRPHRLRWLTQAWHLTLEGGEGLLVRGARQADIDAIALMHGRCTPETTAARYGSAAGRLSRSTLRRQVSAELALVAVAGHARIVALANLVPIDPETADVAVIVEDAYQHRGIGTALTRHIAGGARLVGYRRMHASVGPDGARGERLLRSLGVSGITSDGADGMIALLGHGALGALTGPGSVVRVSSGPRATPIMTTTGVVGGRASAPAD